MIRDDFAFIGTLEMAKESTQSSDSNGNPDTWSMFP